MIYLKLFLSFLQIGLFSFGGGYAAMPLIQEQVVTQHGWLTMTEFTDLITISQMTPGPIAINAATFVGSKISGVPGSIAATCGCILPSCIIVTLIAWFYLRYKKMKMFQSVLESLRPAVVALIASAGIAILHTAFWADGIMQNGGCRTDRISRNRNSAHCILGRWNCAVCCNKMVYGGDLWNLSVTAS